MFKIARKRSININSPKTAVKKENKNKKTKSTQGGGFYYSFLTVILLLCLFQITVSAVLNVSKIISYKAKIVQITKSRDDALAKNEVLKDNIKNLSNIEGFEAIARNNLKMSGEDEVLVIINSNNIEEQEKSTGTKPDSLSFFNIKKHAFGG